MLGRGGVGSCSGSRLTLVWKGADVSQNIADKADAREARSWETKALMQQVRVAVRRKHTPEERARIVLEGFRREVAAMNLCRREGIRPGAFYALSRDYWMQSTLMSLRLHWLWCSKCV